jgi:hypothetical protein
MSDSEVNILKRRQAVERWKGNNREYYLAQKRYLSARPEYLAHRRDMYANRQADLREQGVIPKTMGRPRLYDVAEGIVRCKERSARYRAHANSELLDRRLD